MTLSDYKLELVGRKDTTQIRNILNLFKKEIQYEIIYLTVNFILNNVTIPTNNYLAQSNMTAGISDNLAFYYGFRLHLNYIIFIAKQINAEFLK